MGSTRTLILVVVAMAVVATSVAVSVGRAEDESGTSWIAILNGASETPPHLDTHAHGVALFTVNSDGSISFTLIVANIMNPFAAHIHCGAPGVAGPIGVTLFHKPGNMGRFDGILGQGVISAPDTGNACGWADNAEVLAAIATGNTYVNVHTSNGSPTPGPGNFPGGEIRGQILPAD